MAKYNKNKSSKSRLPQKKISKFCNHKMKTDTVSPLLFTEKSYFYYLVKSITFFNRFVGNFNLFKASDEEINYLIEIINSYNNQSIDNDYSLNENTIAPYFKIAIRNLEKVPLLYDETNSKISKIIEELKFKSSISIKKVIECYKKKYGKILSKTTVHRKLRNKLKYSYRKTIIKPIDLEKKIYKKMSFLFIKIIIRALILKMNLIFLDESNFHLKNPSFKTWLKQGDPAHFGNKNNTKINFLLAVSDKKVINYKFTKKNTNTAEFIKFFLETIDKLNEEEKQKTLFIMDNHVSHISNKTLKIVKKKKLKVLYSVPYESKFNPIELSFRHIKNIIYKKIFKSIEQVKRLVLDVLNSKEYEKTLYKNFLETLNVYINYCIKNDSEDLNL